MSWLVDQKLQICHDNDRTDHLGNDTKREIAFHVVSLNGSFLSRSQWALCCCGSRATSPIIRFTLLPSSLIIILDRVLQFRHSVRSFCDLTNYFRFIKSIVDWPGFLGSSCSGRCTYMVNVTLKKVERLRLFLSDLTSTFPHLMFYWSPPNHRY